MVLDDLPNLKDTYASLYSSAMEDLEVDFDSGLEEDELKEDAAPEDSTIFVAFKGNIGDRDFEQKLGIILENVPGLLHMESNKLKLQKIEPWNSVRVTFNIPREAAERLRILAQNNNQQLRDLGILSVQIEGEGAINLALAQNRSQDVRINGPLGAGSAVRVETAFPMQGGQVNQPQQQMGPRPPQSSTLPQGFQQPVSSPSRNPMVQQGNVPPNFMVMQQQNQGAQGLHPGLGGMPKRLPPGFAAGQPAQSFLQGQVPSTAPGTPVNSGAPQLQTSQNVPHTGGQGSGPPQNQLQAAHGPPSMMQTNLMGLHGNMNNQQAGAGGVSQVNMGNIQGQQQQGPQSQLMGMHQQIVSSQGQMVNIQAQGSLNPQNQMILSRTQLMPQGQMMVTPQNQNLGPSPQRMTPPKQMIPQQGQQMMSTHNQMMGPQGQVLLQQNSMMEQMMTTQMQGNKQPFSTQNQSNVMTGPAQLMRGPTPNMQGNMVQFTGQMMAQQGPVNGNPSQVMGIQGQVLRPTGPGPHISQQLGDTTTTTNNDVNLAQMLPDVPVQQPNMVPSHMQAMQGNNNASGSHFSGHGLPFNTGFSGTPNGNQISCGQNPVFPVNKDVTLTSPLLVNLLQSDISAGHFGVNNKQNNQNANKPKKKKPPRKKKNNQQLEQTTSSEPRPAGLEESDQSSMSGEQGMNLDNSGPKLPDFASRPPGYPSQPVEQRPLQQMPPQLLPHTQQPQQPPQQGQAPPQTPQQQQQMMMMLMMQQDPKSVRLPVPQGVHPPRGPGNPDAQRMPLQQGGSMPVMVNLQGPGANGSDHGGVPAEQTGTGTAEDKAGAHQELLQSAASSQQLTQKKSSVATAESTVQRTELETNAPVVAGQSNETKENCEKSKTPNRRNSRTEDSAASQETVENGQRKRSSRPASASGTAKETSASAMQSKRRKSK
ncbi:nuclear receptor coactivator 6 [Patagioenas fasciata monilis]|uniref:Nuclear receptor coactivator 6 n=1 Tax=Patagioenas fasciata monilis TaxID=372326 RepID=A0A1V4JEN0_PATFA|nr:nuclear receptor coactivator 6 [Patagioenas fasciata monilis]